MSWGARLDDGRDELQQEARHLEQRGVEVVEEVHDEALDVRAVRVLVGHDHEVPIAQLLGALVHLRPRGQAAQETLPCAVLDMRVVPVRTFHILSMGLQELSSASCTCACSP